MQKTGEDDMSDLQDMNMNGKQGKNGLKVHPHLSYGVLGITIGADTLKYMLRHDDGVAIWNRWIRSLEFLLNPVCTDKTDPPLVADIDFTNGDLRNLNLNGINLDDVWLRGCDFSGSSLKNAIIGFAPFAVFKGSDLSNAILASDISGVDFTSARVENLEIGFCCHYQKGFPPIGLPQDLLAMCREIPDDGREGPVKPVGEDVGIKGRMMVMRGWRGA